MKLNIGPNGMLQIDNATIIWPNFSGRGDQFNREGDKNFNLLIDDEEIANAIVELGYNVKIKPAREEGDIPFMHMPVKVNFGKKGPNVYLVSGDRNIKLDEESIGMLDNIEIENVDLDIRPYDWASPDGKRSGRTAYLNGMEVTQKVDRFAARYQGE